MSDNKHHPSYPYAPHDFTEDHNQGYCRGPGVCNPCDEDVARQTRNVPFEADNICDGCGGIGAFDLHGDLLCARCVGDGMVRG